MIKGSQVIENEHFWLAYPVFAERGGQAHGHRRDLLHAGIHVRGVAVLGGGGQGAVGELADAEVARLKAFGFFSRGILLLLLLLMMMLLLLLLLLMVVVVVVMVVLLLLRLGVLGDGRKDRAEVEALGARAVRHFLVLLGKQHSAIAARCRVVHCGKQKGSVILESLFF